MKKVLITTAIAAVLGGTSFSANALSNSSVLSFDAGTPETTGCLVGTFFPSTGTCAYGAAVEVTDMGGSYFAMDLDGSAQGTPTSGVAGDTGFSASEKTAIVDLGAGIALGAGQGFVDAPWAFSGNLGNHNVLGTGLTAIDNNHINMTGWNVFWGNPAADIDMGAGVASQDPRSVDSGGFFQVGNTANLTCTDANVCGDGAGYVLDYTAVVPSGGFAGVAYTLHLEGTISEGSAVPVPAAVWLFGSGLLGLVGVARRKAHA